MRWDWKSYTKIKLCKVAWLELSILTNKDGSFVSFCFWIISKGLTRQIPLFSISLNSLYPRYFAAGKDRGIFVTLNKVVKLDADENFNESCDVSLCESSLSTVSPSPAPSTHTRSSSVTPTTRVRRSLSLRHHETKSATPSMTGSVNSKAQSNFSR